MEDASSPQLLFFGKFKISKSLFTLLVIGFTGFIFYLDVITRDFIAFDVFYFPSLLLAAWYLGWGAGLLTALLTALMWLLAQWDAGYFYDLPNAIGDGCVHLATFAMVAWMTHLVHKKTVLLEATSKELIRSNNELEQFAYRAAHDLQSPLATIHGFAELMEEKQKESGDEETKECLVHIDKSIKRMSAFIRALLNYARVMTREAPAVPVAFGEIVRGVLEDLHFQTLEKKAQVVLDPLPTLRASPELIELLFQNLIGNALKYCEKEPRIRIAAERKGKEWFFSVRDNGIGIPEEAQKRIFVMFEKVATPRKYPGTGIGLATCQKIVERYHGRLWVESPPKIRDGAAPQGAGEGSIFYFMLPAV